MTPLPRIRAFAALGVLALVVPGGQVLAQSEGGLLAVERVELISPRMDGPQALVLFTAKGKLRPASGTYVSEERRVITMKDGRIVGLSDPPAKIDRFQVLSVDPVMVRHYAPARLFLRDAEERTVALPDGRFTSREGMTLVVREGAIVAYGKGR